MRPFGNALDTPVVWRRIDRGRIAQHRGHTWRHNHRNLGVPFGNVGIDALLIISTIARERGDWPGDRLEQGADLQGIISVMRVSEAATISPVLASRPRCSLRLEGRALVPCFSISHSPEPHSFSPVLSTSRCMGSALLSASAECWLRQVQGRRPAAQCCVIGDAQRQAEQADDGADQSFGLTKGKPNTARMVSAVRMARASTRAGRPGSCVVQRPRPQSPPR